MDKSINFDVLYLLKHFSKEIPLSEPKLYSIFIGKRTPSILFNIEKYQFFESFRICPRLQRSDLKNALFFLKSKNLIYGDKNLFLTDDGYQVLIQEKNRLNKVHINNLKYLTMRKGFFESFLLMNQVISEGLYSNNMYSPIIKDIDIQNLVKKLIKQNDYKEIESKWVKEVIELFNKLDAFESELLSSLLVGHDISGLTYKEIKERYEWTSFETYVNVENLLDHTISLIFSGDFDILYTFTREIYQNYWYGLSESSFLTFKYVKLGYSFNEIANVRRLKESTIHEHIQEIALIHKEFDGLKYIPTAIVDYLNQLFQKNPTIAYRDIDTDQSIDFLSYRLVQLERLRNE